MQTHRSSHTGSRTHLQGTTSHRFRRPLTVALASVAAFGLFATPAFADSNHNNGKGNDDRIHATKQSEKDRKEAEKRSEKARKEAQKEAQKEAEKEAQRLAKLQKCDGKWAAASSGRPSILRSRGASGLYVWHDGDKWNVYATHPDTALATFQGTVTFDAPAVIEEKRLERGSDVVLTTANQASFTFRNYGGLDGVRLRSDCAATVTVAGTINGQPLSPQQIFVGKAAAYPAAAPFFEQRPVSRPAAPAVTVPPVTVPSCALPAWNAAYTGQPANLRNNAAAGLYVWIDGDHIRLETTRPNNTPSVISGSIVVNAAVTGLKGRQLDSADVLSAQPTGATFTFTNSGAIDGLELTAPCASQILITATIDGQPVVAQQVWLGRNAINPTSTPVQLTR